MSNMRRRKAASVPHKRIPTREGAMVRAGGWNAVEGNMDGRRE